MNSRDSCYTRLLLAWGQAKPKMRQRLTGWVSISTSPPRWNWNKSNSNLQLIQYLAKNLYKKKKFTDVLHLEWADNRERYGRIQMVWTKTHLIKMGREIIFCENSIPTSMLLTLEGGVRPGGYCEVEWRRWWWLDLTEGRSRKTVIFSDVEYRQQEQNLLEGQSPRHPTPACSARSSVEAVRSLP